ncbi:G-type lectin S-receptor-like serine/threonine-protein kinase SD2-5 [Rhodamnia argentea]|uniref:G-type lectin S-receptor-like serine/threonine-protein kinase SD2-5 n=1 Tax=Rhodamnia argentea TaxID=178133 RepID=A0ABM3HPP6_9MYRT|nr:G-type lectin S-receptor-like serine/threonine-protein kinase SD2-5 [Rhodamnia argentea]
MSVVGMNLTDTGNIVLFDKNNATVWQSFDHPTDSLVLGQKLSVGQKLTPSTSLVNGIEQGLLSLSLTPSGLFARIETYPLQVYLHVNVNLPNTSDDSNYIEIAGGDLALFMDSTRNGSVLSVTGPGSGASVQYMKFEPDGHLRSYQWDEVGWSVRDDLFEPYLGDCGYPMACDIQIIPDLANTDKESCREACACNCSCTTAFYLYHSGSCYLVSPVIILSYSAGSVLALIILNVVSNSLVLWRQEADEVGEEYLEQLPGLPTRFTYDDLIAVTEVFSKKLGEGGFGTVFEGTLSDGTKVAVKRLGGLRQIKKSFLAEFETIGNIHHVNLARLLGLCSEKSHMLLIYEYMSRGSLDEWIFHKSKGSFVLDWRKRRKIIYDIAKGLNYLHEECTWKIVHMDIKPQNILLDEKFNAKIADFGLSKLLDRGQSQAVTTMRGTPGYLAPEWLSATITEKVDVYSFGVVVLEIVCGRKVFDSSQNKEDMYLVEVFKRKVEDGRLLDMVDNTCEDMQLNQPRVVNIMRIASWCLQCDFSKRPSMSMVIKVLDGSMEIPEDLDNDFSHSISMNFHESEGVALPFSPPPVKLQSSHLISNVIDRVMHSKQELDAGDETRINLRELVKFNRENSFREIH